MMDIQKLVKQYYSIDPRVEWKRLEKDAYHKLEFQTTLHFLKKHLPKKGIILDAGGGPGRYTIELAKRGYKVVLLDLTPANLELAKERIKKAGAMGNVIQIVQGSITDLSVFFPSSFDAVICLGGPLSHIEKPTDRAKAVRELKRVAKKGAPIFLSVMGKFGSLMRASTGWPQEIALTKHFHEMALRGDDYMWRRKYFAHFFTLEEMEHLLGRYGLRVIERAGLEGLGSPCAEALNQISKNKKAWKNWLSVHYKLCTHPSVVDTSLHFMVIGKK